MQRPDPEKCAACGATWPDQREEREPEKVHTSNSITDAGETDPPNERSPKEDVAQDHENAWDTLREPWATSDPMLALDLAVKQILHDVLSRARRAGGLRLTERHTNSVRAMSSTGEDGRGNKRLDAGSSEDALSRTPRLHLAHVVRSRTIRDVEVSAPVYEGSAGTAGIACAVDSSEELKGRESARSSRSEDAAH